MHDCYERLRRYSYKCIADRLDADYADAVKTICDRALKNKALHETYRAVIKHFGADHQKRKAAEELSELLSELQKDINGKGEIGNLIAELADVENVCAQLRMIYDADDLTDHWKSVKMNRVMRRIKDERGNNT